MRRRRRIKFRTQNQATYSGVEAVVESVPLARPVNRFRVPQTVVYAIIFVAIIVAAALSYRLPSSAVMSAAGLSADDAQTSVDDIVATIVAAETAETANLPVATNVANLSVSLIAKEEIVASSATGSVTKEQVLQPVRERRAIITHTVKKGESVKTLAKKYSVSENTIKWANDLTSNSLSVGKKVSVPPVDGVVYTVKKKDTIDSLAKRYRADKARIIAFNNLELSGLKAGKKIVIPSGTLPEVDRPGYQPPVAPSGGGGSSYTPSYSFTAGSVGNRYVYGYCTWYVYEKRASMGSPVGSFWGNANTWAVAARSQGFKVDNNPAPGAIFQTSAGGGGYGHVGIIESVNHSAGTVTYSDMNGGAGWNRVGRATIPISQAKAQWTFIH